MLFACHYHLRVKNGFFPFRQKMYLRVRKYSFRAMLGLLSLIPYKDTHLNFKELLLNNVAHYVQLCLTQTFIREKQPFFLQMRT